MHRAEEIGLLQGRQFYVAFELAANEPVRERDAKVASGAAGDDLVAGFAPDGGDRFETGGGAGFGRIEEGGDVAEDGEFFNGEVRSWGD